MRTDSFRPTFYLTINSLFILFDLFLQSGVYLAYAEQYLEPDQIDEVSIEPCLGSG